MPANFCRQLHVPGCSAALRRRSSCDSRISHDSIKFASPLALLYLAISSFISRRASHALMWQIPEHTEQFTARSKITKGKYSCELFVAILTSCYWLLLTVEPYGSVFIWLWNMIRCISNKMYLVIVVFVRIILGVDIRVPDDMLRWAQKIIISIINLLTPNVNYSGRTAPLTSKVAFYIFIQQI